MKRDYDEPMFIDVVSCNSDCPAEQVEAEIKELCFEQPFAVLATQGDGQPYTALISFAASDDLTHLVFSTPTRTKKFCQIKDNHQVSILVDTRSLQPESINLVRAVTITGKARPLEDPGEIEGWSKLLLEKHGYLEKFVRSESSSLILVRAVDYSYVRRFQEVYQWTP